MAGRSRSSGAQAFQLARLLPLGIVAAFLLTACSRTASAPPPNVLVIVIDTLRADHLGCYGYARPTSPAIDAFAARSTRYEHCISAAPWTLPSHASLFTGKFSHEHGLHIYVDDHFRETIYPLADEHVTLAEELASDGYETAAYYANSVYLDPRYNLQQGFATWQFTRGWSDSVNRAAFEFLARAHEKPFFLFLNYFDTHRIYNTTPREGVTPKPVVRDHGEALDRLIAAVMPGVSSAPADVARTVTDQYDTAVANVDAGIGELFAELERLKLFDDTVVVLTSDHGEYLGEHLLAGHGKDVYAEATSIPLIVKSPGQRTGHVESKLASTVDVPHLVLGDLEPAIGSRSLERFPHAPGSGIVVSEQEFAQPKDLLNPVWGHRFRRVRTAYFEWPWKLIASSDGEHELYDLANDPHEIMNLVVLESARAAKMQSTLASALSEADKTAWHPSRASVPVKSDDAHSKELRALGYAGTDR
jgi:arylsulfatase A-like enzyme